MYVIQSKCGGWAHELLRWQFGLDMMVTRPVNVAQVHDWCISYDLSETIMVLMSAEGLYKKSKIQETSVAASQPPDKDRWMQRCQVPAKDHQGFS